MRIYQMYLRRNPFSEVCFTLENNKGEVLHTLEKGKTLKQKICDAYTLTKGEGGIVRKYVDGKITMERTLLVSKSSRHKKKKKKSESDIKESELLSFA